MVPPNNNNSCWLNSVIALLTGPNSEDQSALLGQTWKYDTSANLRTVLVGSRQEAFAAQRSLWKAVHEGRFAGTNPLQHKDASEAMSYIVEACAAARAPPFRLMSDTVHLTVCQECRHCDPKVQSLASIDVVMPAGDSPSLKACLAATNAWSDIEYQCPKCEKYQPGKASTVAAVMDTDVLLTVKRFEEDGSVVPTVSTSEDNAEDDPMGATAPKKRFKKDARHIKVPLELPARTLLAPISGVNSEWMPLVPSNAKLGLVAAVIHTGTMEGGHYYALVKRDGVWYRLDDDRPLEVVEKPNFGQAYILRYSVIENAAAPALRDVLATRYDNARQLLAHANGQVMAKPNVVLCTASSSVIDLTEGSATASDAALASHPPVSSMPASGMEAQHPEPRAPGGSIDSDDDGGDGDDAMHGTGSSSRSC